MRPLLLVLVMAMALLAGAPGFAQQAGGDAPVSPERSVTPEQTLLSHEPRIEGRIDIPDPKARVLIQPEGRRWDFFHETLLHRGGAIVLLGTLALLVLGRIVLGRLRITAGRAGQTVVRFSGFERFAHWLTAVSFVLLGLTGLNITFGKSLLLPLLGPESFSAWSQLAKTVHDFVSFAFILGLALIVALWFKDNLPRKVDAAWLAQGGGFVGKKHPHAGRFNAGEKLVYWLSALGGLAVIVSGLALLFPFYGTGIAGMQIAQVIHAAVALLFVALILGHIYMGTFGMEGAMEAMQTGQVDVNWAREHHDLWAQEKLGPLPVSEPPVPPAAPAEAA
jgi:formate dehydrogenase subunit gamma